jgi:hypothetical protein
MKQVRSSASAVADAEPRMRAATRTCRESMVSTFTPFVVR